MFCPKCSEGIIINITFKRTEAKAQICDVCNTVWFEGESIDEHTGMPLEMYSQENGYEYTIDHIDEEDYEFQPVEYTSAK